VEAVAVRRGLRRRLQERRGTADYSEHRAQCLKREECAAAGSGAEDQRKLSQRQAVRMCEQSAPAGRRGTDLPEALIAVFLATLAQLLFHFTELVSIALVAILVSCFLLRRATLRAKEPASPCPNFHIGFQEQKGIFQTSRR